MYIYTWLGKVCLFLLFNNTRKSKAYLLLVWFLYTSNIKSFLRSNLRVFSMFEKRGTQNHENVERLLLYTERFYMSISV